MADDIKGFVYVPQVGYVAEHLLSYERISEFKAACDFLNSRGYATENRTYPVIIESKADLEKLLEICGSRMLTAEEAQCVLAYARTNAQDLYKDMISDKEKEGLAGEVVKSGKKYMAIMNGDWEFFLNPQNRRILSPNGEPLTSYVESLLNCLGAREVKDI